MAKKMNTPQADGRYRVRVYVGIKDGKKQYKSVYGRTQKEADIKAEELRVSLRKGIDISSSNDSFKTWANYWLTSKKHEVSEDRYKALLSRANVWIDGIGNAQITQIKPFELQTILFSISAQNPYTGKPMAKKTIRGYVQIINAIFDFAVDNRVIDYNPANKLKAPQGAVTSQRRALTDIERQWVMEFEHKAKPSAMLLMLSGLRRGEATALKWSDIDFVNNKIYVTRSYNFKTKDFKTPKNGKSRVVSVPQILIDYLRTLPRVSPIFVLTNAKGQMMTDDSWKRMYKSYMCDLNIEYGFGGVEKAPSKFAPTKMPMLITPFTPHELRHTFCTIMYEAGIDALTAKEQLGHSDIKTTLSIYTHLSNQHKETQVNKLDTFLQKGGSKVAQL